LVKRADDYKIILICVRKWMKNKSEKEAWKGPNFKQKSQEKSKSIKSFNKTSLSDRHGGP
jgi:hypothetical protein